MAQGARPTRPSRQPTRTNTGVNIGRRDPVKKKSADDATITYIKKILCQKPAKSGGPNDTLTSDVQDKPLDELLPPLTSSNEIDIQLYAIISVILSQFVQVWYNRITPDTEFVAEVVQIIAHCTRGLEDRLRNVDLEVLLLDEIPALLDEHLLAAATARETSSTHYDTDAEGHVGSIYHSLRPHSAMSPFPKDEATTAAQKDNETAWSQLLIGSILPLVLPPEDLRNPCLHVLVTEIFSEMIFHNGICGKVSEPWLLWEAVTKIIYLVRPHTQPPKVGVSSPNDRLSQYGLLSASKTIRGSKSRPAPSSIVSWTFWSAVQSVSLIWLLLRSFVLALIDSPSLPPRRSHSEKPDSYSNRKPHKDDIDRSIAEGDAISPAIVEMGVWTCTSHLLLLPQRMPWLFGLTSMLQWLSLNGPGKVCRTNAALDRLMSAQINQRVLNPALLPPLLQAVRNAMFPDNAMAKPRVPPSPEEALAIKRECARAVVEAIPPIVRSYYFATKDTELMMKDVENTLELFADQYINKHLVVGLVDLIVIRLFPELAECENS